MINTMEDAENYGERKVKIVKQSSLARQILMEGGDSVRIVDIKPDRNDPDKKRSVYAFIDDDDFQEIFARVLEENNRNKETSTRREIEDLKKQIADLKQMLVDKE